MGAAGELQAVRAQSSVRELCLQRVRVGARSHPKLVGGLRRATRLGEGRCRHMLLRAQQKDCCWQSAKNGPKEILQRLDSWPQLLRCRHAQHARRLRQRHVLQPAMHPFRTHHVTLVGILWGDLCMPQPASSPLRCMGRGAATTNVRRFSARRVSAEGKKRRSQRHRRQNFPG